MPGLLNPDNTAPETNREFKEGYVRVDRSEFKVMHFEPPENPKPNYKPRADYVALVFSVTRLDENMEPLTDEHDNPLTEDIPFSVGGKSLLSVHPGAALSAEDKEIDDLGDKPNTAGPTLYILNPDFRIHPRSGIHMLYDSVRNKVPDEMMDRIWAPDWEKSKLFMTSRMSGKDNMVAGDDGVEREYPIKYVTKVIGVDGYTKKGAAAGANAKASTNGKVDAVSEKAIKPLLNTLSTEAAGEELSFKVLVNRISKALKESKIDVKQHVPILALVKDEHWLVKHAEEFDMTIDAEAKTVTFNEAA